MHPGVGGELPSIQRELLTQLSCLLWVVGWGGGGVGGGVVLNIINKYTSHSQSALRTKLMMIKVTLRWKAKGGPAFTGVAGGDVWEC